MSAILTGVTDSLKAFLAENLPEDLKGETDLVKLAALAKTKQEEATTSLEERQSSFATASGIKEFYEYLQKDVLSMAGEKPQTAIDQVLAAKSAALKEQLAMLADAKVTSLPDDLVQCTKEANKLRNNFADISDILDSLEGDLMKTDDVGDYAYNQLTSNLEADGKEEAVNLLKAYKPSEDKASLETVQGVFNTFYEKIKGSSMNYQETLAPELSLLMGMEAELAASIEATNTDIATNLTEVSALLAEETTALAAAESSLAALQHAIPQISSLGEAVNNLTPAEETAPEEEGEAGESEKPVKIADTVLADLGKTQKELKALGVDLTTFGKEEEIAIKMAKAKIELASIDAEMAKCQDKIAKVASLLEKQKAVNDKLQAYKDRLTTTRTASEELRKIIDKLKKHLDDEVVPGLGALVTSMQADGNEQLTIIDNFLASLKALGGVEAKVTKINDSISEATTDGDIKVYFSEISGILKNFPEPGQAVINKALAIHGTLMRLAAWAEKLNTDIGNQLADNFGGSALKLTPQASTGKKLKALLDGLKASEVTDDKLKAMYYGTPQAAPAKKSTDKKEESAAAAPEKSQLALGKLKEQLEGVLASKQLEKVNTEAQIAFLEKFFAEG